MIQIKNAAELEKMRKAAAISAAALKAGGEAIEPGITTAEIDKIIYDFIVRHGARPNFLHLYGFPATACISVNDTVIHGIPSHDIVIRPGDIVSIDTGAKVGGFNGDNACTYAVGKVDLEAQRLLEVTKASLYKGIEQAVAGNRIGDIGYAVQSYCEDAGFSVVRDFVGHGTGKELHEDPEVPALLVGDEHGVELRPVDILRHIGQRQHAAGVVQRIGIAGVRVFPVFCQRVAMQVDQSIAVHGVMLLFSFSAIRGLTHPAA